MNLASSKKATVTLVLGGISSGKSKFAESLVNRSGHPVRYFSSMLPVDDEMRAKIKAHQDRRPAGWKTVEPSEIDLSNILSIAEGVTEKAVMVDSAGTLMSYLSELICEDDKHSSIDRLSDDRLVRVGTKKQVYDRSAELVSKFVSQLSSNSNIDEVVIVSEELGGGLVSTDRMTRSYVSAMGDMNQELALISDKVYLVVAGQSISLKG